MSPIIAVAHTGVEEDLFAIAEADRRVRVFSLSERRLVAFETLHERRLAITRCDGRPILVTASYHGDGVAAYDARSGVELWRRKDLKLVQTVDPMPVDSKQRAQIGIACEESDCSRPRLRGSRDYRVLDAASGRGLWSLRDVRRLFSHPSSSRAVAVDRDGGASLLVLERTEDRADLGAPRFLLDVAFEQDRLALAEGMTDVRCVDSRGRTSWTWPSDGSPVNAIRVARHEPTGCWVVMDFSKRVSLVLLDADGKLVDRSPEWWPGGSDGEFLAGARFFISMDGTVRSVPRAEILWRFDPPT